MSRVCKIAYLTSGGGEADGITKTVLNLASYLDRAQYEPAVITLKPCALLEEALPKAGVPLLKSDPLKPFSSLVALLRASDLVHIQDSPGNLFLYLAARAACPRIVETIHTTQVGKNFFPDMHTTCVSRYVLSLQPGTDKTHMIYDSADVPSVLPPRKPSSTVRLIEVGRPEKFLFPLADILPRLGHRSLEGMTVGGTRAGPPNLRSIPFRADVERLFGETDLLVHFPWEEGLGLVVIEAMAAGVVPVTCGLGGLLEIIEDGESGFFLKDDTFNEAVRLVSEAVEMAATRPDLFERMRSAAHRRVKETFSTALAVRKHAELYRMVLDGPSVEGDPALDDARLLDAMDLYALDQPRAALKTFGSLGSPAPSFLPELLRAITAARAGEPTAAAGAFARALELRPASLFAANACASFARARADLPTYLRWLEQSLALSPFQLDLYAEAADEFASRGDWASAEQYLLRLQNIVEWRFSFARKRLGGLLQDFHAKRAAAGRKT